MIQFGIKLQFVDSMMGFVEFVDAFKNGFKKQTLIPCKD